MPFNLRSIFGRSKTPNIVKEETKSKPISSKLEAKTSTTANLQLNAQPTRLEINSIPLDGKVFAKILDEDRYYELFNFCFNKYAILELENAKKEMYQIHDDQARLEKLRHLRMAECHLSMCVLSNQNFPRTLILPKKVETLEQAETCLNKYNDLISK